MTIVRPKSLPTGIKAIISYFILVSFFNFIVNFYEVWKAEYWVQMMSVEKREIALQFSKQTDSPAESIDDFKALGRALALPRVLAQWPVSTICVLIFAILSWGAVEFKQLGQNGSISTCRFSYPL